MVDVFVVITLEIVSMNIFHDPKDPMIGGNWIT
jgi:hypothetical protein